MADRTSASIFGTLFEVLAEAPTAEHKALAFKMYRISQGYDFSPYQMGADEACEKLGLRRRDVNSPNGRIVGLWPDDPGYEQAAPKGENDAEVPSVP